MRFAGSKPAYVIVLGEWSPLCACSGWRLLQTSWLLSNACACLLSADRLARMCSRLVQYKTLLARYTRSYWRNPPFNTTRLLLAFIAALAQGTFYWGRGSNYEDVQSVQARHTLPSLVAWVFMYTAVACMHDLRAAKSAARAPPAVTQSSGHKEAQQ